MGRLAGFRYRQHGTQTQRLEVHDAGAASYGRGHGDTGAPTAGLPRSQGAPSQPLEWWNQELGIAGQGLVEPGERTV